MQPYYSDDSCTIYHADAREVLPEMASDFTVVTDPPYGIALDATWRRALHERNGSVGDLCTDLIQGDEDAEWVPPLLASFKRRVVFGFPYLTDSATTGWLVWDKEPGFSGRSLTSPVEMAYSTAWRGFRAIRQLWSGYMRSPGAEDKVGHPTQKPVALMRAVIDLAGGDNVLDPFLGSGTTLRAAKDLGRRAVGIELSERYCEIAARRLAQEALDFGVPA